MSEETKKYEGKTIAVYSGFGGIEIKAIEHGIDDYVLFAAGTMGKQVSYHKCKIYHAGGRPYFEFHGVRIHFDECITI